MRWRRPVPTPLRPEPDCDQVGSVMQAYLDGELGPEDAEVVARHLEHCERCSIEADTVRKVIDAIKRQRPDLDPTPLQRLTVYVERLATDGPAAG